MITEDWRIKNNGGKWWHTSDHHSPNLTKSSLGEFFHHVIRVGAQIGSIWCMDKNYNRSTVLVTVFMTDKMKEELEESFKYRFKPPTEVCLN